MRFCRNKKDPARIVPVDGTEVLAYAVCRSVGVGGTTIEPLVGVTTDVSVAASYVGRPLEHKHPNGPKFRVYLVKKWQLPDRSLVSADSVAVLPGLDHADAE